MAKIKTYQADLALVLATFFWGSSFIPVKTLVGVMSTYEILAIRYAITGIIMLPLIIWHCQKNKWRVWPETKASLVLTLYCFTGNIFQTTGMKYTSATNAAFVTSLCLVFVPLFLSLFKNQMPSLKLWVCVGLGLGGLAIFSLTPDLKINYGDGLVFICSILFALHIIFTSQYTLQFNPLYLLGIQYILQCLLSLIAKLFWDTNPWIYPNHGQIGSFIYLAIFSTGIAFFLQAWFQRYTDTTRAALIYIMEPVFAAILGYLLLGEILSGKQWLGASIMFIALILSEMKFGKQEI